MNAKLLGSLHGRLICILLAISVYVWLTASALTVFDTRHEVDELLDGHLSLVASTLLTDTGLGEGDHEVDAPTLHRMAPRVAFQVFVDRQLTIHSLNAPHSPLSQVSSGFSTVRLSDGAEWRVFAASRNDGNTQVYVAEQILARDEILMSILRSILWPIALALTILVGGSWWSVRMALAPFGRLREALAHRRDTLRGQIDLLDAPTEIRPVVDELNALLSQLHDRIERERQFTADVAHELRTPIAAIKINLDVLEAQMSASDSNTATVRALQQAMKRTTRLIDQLLELARLDSQEDPQITWVTDIVATVGEVAAELIPLTLDRDQDLSFDRPDQNFTLDIKGRPEVVATLIRNLVDNASKYSGMGATIKLAVSCSESRVTFLIEDSGPGLSQAEQAQLGTRYFRGDRTSAIGSGLGWSIISKIAQQTKAEVSISTSSSLGGLKVEVSWPRSSRLGESPRVSRRLVGLS